MQGQASGPPPLTVWGSLLKLKKERSGRTEPQAKPPKPRRRPVGRLARQRRQRLSAEIPSLSLSLESRQSAPARVYPF